MLILSRHIYFYISDPKDENIDFPSKFETEIQYQ